MSYEIRIDWLFGCPRDPQASEVKAIAAARRIFDRAKIDGFAAQQSWMEQGGIFGDEGMMTGDAVTWLAARAAAGKAATSNWPDPSQAGISIECRQISAIQAAG